MLQAPKYISGEEVEKLLDLKELLTSIETGLGNYSKGKDGGVVQPVRLVVPIEKHHGNLGVMPGYSSFEDALATKVVAFYPENKDLPTHQAWVLMQDPTNGSLNAIIDGGSITAIRTGIASAVATKHLANPNSHILTLLGAGVQARSHFKALLLLHKFDEVRIFSRTRASAQKLAKEIGKTAKVCSSVEEAVEDADIIVTVSFATTPILKAEWVKPGAHINAVGACRPDWRELESSLMQQSVVYCDSREACSQESGDVILSGCDIYAEIGEVINGEKLALWEKTTVFKSVGMAIEDVLSAKIVFDKYMRIGSTLAEK
ncbi:hypothetical protein CAPTEDRAFT_141157 [Capitella teleta]|uniref:Ketimine reductase mu-crystallin n=1 Tax=Capitella teleta TaxID=283909 RepID=R7TKQ5_CAPTE|nr:hypothetical protein CAPTEDRAFT_141157 [Capitella teleta]|eukprot:ELT92131.1 hypothetical protein CAPTEDRAFT_141157 [Capitella teleta]